MDLPEEPIIKTEIQPTNLENTQTIENIEKIQLQLETKIKNIQEQRDQLLNQINECSIKLKETEFLTKKLEEKNKQIEQSHKDVSEKYVSKLKEILETFN